MLDLGFVRDNLPLITEKLRQRGLDAGALLAGFGDIDAKRRHAITAMETLKAERNRASEEIAKVKKSGGDVTELIAKNKSQREEIETLEKSAAEFDEQLKQLLVGIPKFRMRAFRRARLRMTTWKCDAGARRRSLISLPSLIGRSAKTWACSTSSAR